MSNPLYLPGKSISELHRPQLEDIVRRTQFILWYDQGWDPGKDWNADTPGRIAATLAEYDLIPMEVEEEATLNPTVFLAFQATGRDTLNLASTLKDEGMIDRPGRVYFDQLWIEDTCSWPLDAPGYGKGRWYTLIDNFEFQSDDLEEIERILCTFAVSEGYYP